MLPFLMFITMGIIALINHILVVRRVFQLPELFISTEANMHKLFYENWIKSSF